MRSVGYLSYIQEQNKARFIDESHILPFLYTLGHIFIPLCGRYLGFSEKPRLRSHNGIYFHYVSLMMIKTVGRHFEVVILFPLRVSSRLE